MQSHAAARPPAAAWIVLARLCNPGVAVEAKQPGLQPVPALVLGQQKFHVDFGAAIHDLG
jgi:hypothetical protein